MDSMKWCVWEQMLASTDDCAVRVGIQAEAEILVRQAEKAYRDAGGQAVAEALTIRALFQPEMLNDREFLATYGRVSLLGCIAMSYKTNFDRLFPKGGK